MDAYLKYFRGGRGYTAVGEVCASYMTNLRPEVIRDVCGRVRIIVVLRNPVERFISHYRHYIRQGKLDKRGFQALTLNTMASATGLLPELLRFGQYTADLQSYLDTFGAARVHVIINDDIDAAPVTVVQRLYRFLGVNPDFVPPAIGGRVNQGYVHRYEPLEIVRRHVSALLRARADWAIEPIGRSRPARAFKRLNRDPAGLTVAPGVRERLHDYYAEDVCRLERLLELDLSAWRREPCLQPTAAQHTAERAAMPRVP